jgi:hypothetical protein
MLLIASCSDPVAADFALHCAQRHRRVALVGPPGILELVKERGQARHVSADADSRARRRLTPFIHTYPAEGLDISTFLADHATGGLAGVVVFLDRKTSPRQETLLDSLARICLARNVGARCVVSSWRAHLGDSQVTSAEAQARRQLAAGGGRLVMLRPGNVLSTNARLNQVIRRWGSWFQLLPPCFRTCFIDAGLLFATIGRVLNDKSGRRGPLYTVLGPNRAWHTLRERGAGSKPRACLRLAQRCARAFLVEQGALLAFTWLAKRLPALRAWNVDTLHPTTQSELLALHNRYNACHVKIVGYNNGVNHFGQAFPGKTVVSTTRCAGPARLARDRAKLDAGVTIRDAMSTLAAAGKELCVLPNYSYVSVGTSFFVPIHGSACTSSTLAETIDKVILHDAATDRFIVARRGSPEFAQHMYNQDANLLLLRLYLRVKDKSRYYLQREQLVEPSSEEVLGQFADRDAANVELRKAGAGSRTVGVCKYYTEAGRTRSAALEVPRDTLGSLWDRLEENRLSSVLFHGLTRRLAHHVELFLSKEQFAVFWNTHWSLPIKKIQLRYIKRDGFPHSPFQTADCISADLFMLKKHREPFHNYLRRQLGAVRMNPGKHSM